MRSAHYRLSPTYDMSARKILSRVCWCMQVGSFRPEMPISRDVRRVLPATRNSRMSHLTHEQESGVSVIRKSNLLLSRGRHSRSLVSPERIGSYNAITHNHRCYATCSARYEASKGIHLEIVADFR